MSTGNEVAQVVPIFNWDDLEALKAPRMTSDLALLAWHVVQHGSFDFVHISKWKLCSNDLTDRLRSLAGLVVRQESGRSTLPKGVTFIDRENKYQAGEVTVLTRRFVLSRPESDPTATMRFLVEWGFRAKRPGEL